MNLFDRQSHQMEELFACFGYCLYRAQCLERTMAIAMTTICGPGPDKITSAQYDRLLESHFSKTLGELINRIRATIPVSKEFKSALSETSKKRNWLVHKYFWERSVEFTTEDGRQSMICELKEIAHLFEEIDSALTAIMRQWGEKHGVTEEVIEKEMKRLKEDKKWSD